MNKICDGNVKSLKSTVPTTLTQFHNAAILQKKTIHPSEK